MDPSQNSEKYKSAQSRFGIASNLSNIFHIPESDCQEPRDFQADAKIKNNTPRAQVESNRQKTMKKITMKTIKREKVVQQPRKFTQYEERALKRTVQLLRNKAIVVWIFIIQQPSAAVTESIKAIYQDTDDESYLVPLFSSVTEAARFLNIENVNYKLVVDLSNIEEALTYQQRNQIVQYHIYMTEKNDEIEALQYRSAENQKVKGIYFNISRVLERARAEVLDQIKLLSSDQGKIVTEAKDFKFPCFLMLSGKDKYESTLHRANHYGSMKIAPGEQIAALGKFASLVALEFGSDPLQQQNLDIYSSADHSVTVNTFEHATSALRFYTKQSFFYKIINRMLRTLKSTDQFFHCSLPFAETYQAIKYFYKKDGRLQIPNTYYRGTVMSSNDIETLRNSKGKFIETFGFMSASKDINIAKKFMKNYTKDIRNKVMIFIHVIGAKVPENKQYLDHGFVDINANRLAEQSLEEEQEVLFNVLNVYKVLSAEKKGLTYEIHLEYGSIIELLNSDQKTLSPDDTDTLVNYQYCASFVNFIEDYGDVFIINTEYQKAREYYDRRLQEEPNLNSLKIKKAKVAYLLGDMMAAQKLCELQLKQLEAVAPQLNKEDILEAQNQLKEANVLNEDYVQAAQNLTEILKITEEWDVLCRAQQLRERGIFNFQQGDIVQAKKDLAEAQRILENIDGELNRIIQREQNVINQRSCFECFKKEQAEARRIQAHTIIAKVEAKRLQLPVQQHNIKEELLKIAKANFDVNRYTNDKNQSTKSTADATKCLQYLKEHSRGDPLINAEIIFIEAVINSNAGNIGRTQNLIEEAVILTQQSSPYEMKISQYTKTLGDFQSTQCHSLLNTNANTRYVPDLPEPTHYNAEAASQLKSKSIDNYQRSLNVLKFNKKPENSLDVMQVKNKIGLLEFYTHKLENCEKIIDDILSQDNNTVHSEMARTLSIKAKVLVAKGRIGEAHQNIEKAENYIISSICKKKRAKDPKYLTALRANDTYLEIRLTYCHIVRRMEQGRLIKELKVIEKNVHAKIRKFQTHPLQANVYEELGSAYFQDNYQQFKAYFEKSLEIKRKQLGFYNTANIHTICNYCNFLVICKRQGDLKKAEQLIEKANGIYEYVDKADPISYMLFLSKGLIYEGMKRHAEASGFLKQSLKYATSLFDTGHIVPRKIKWSYAKSLRNSSKNGESLNILNELIEQIERQKGTYHRDENLRLSQMAAKEVSNLLRLDQSQATSTEMNLYCVNQVDRQDE